MLFTRQHTKPNAFAGRTDSNTFIQPKLNIGRPGDKYEVEADAMADRVVQKMDASPHTSFFRPATSVQGQLGSDAQKRGEEEVNEKLLAEGISPLVQLAVEEEEIVQEKCADCEAEENNVQAKAIANSTGEDAIEDQLKHSSGGSTMDTDTKASMETGFGADFGNVKIHTDSKAVQMNKELGAQAFTNGSDVYFNEGKYNPTSSDGKHLLAHELTHTIQQGAALKKADDGHNIQRVADKSNPPTTSSCDQIDTGPGAPVGTHVDFGQGGTLLNTAHRELIGAEMDAWNARGRTDQIIIDGFASSEGTSGTNWNISCNRARAVEAEFASRGVPGGMLTTIAHGETEEFSSTALPPNRRAVIRVVRSPQPNPDPGCPTSITENTTLTSDCTNAISIDADNIILDGGGHTITGPGTGSGILLRGRTGVRIVNCMVTNFRNGFALRDSHANLFTNNTAFANPFDGFDINSSNNNRFIQNTVRNNPDHGFELDGSSDNEFIQNTVHGSNDAFDTEGPPRGGPPAPRNSFIRNNAHNNTGAGYRILSDNNTITNNSSIGNEDGYRIQGNDNTLNGNNCISNTRDGLRIEGNNNGVTGNSCSGNLRDGFRIEGNDNEVIGNRCSSNTRDGIRIQGNDNVFRENIASGNNDEDVDVRNGATGNSCTGNNFGSTNGQCPTDVP